jgi:hypothetical protein
MSTGGRFRISLPSNKLRRGKKLSEIGYIKSIDPADIDTVNTVAKADIDTINTITMPGGAPPGPEWHVWFDNAAWSASQGWWSTDHWVTNGWELMLQDIEEPPTPTKIRITHSSTPKHFVLKDHSGGTEYAHVNSYTSGDEVDIDITGTWGRIYLEGGSFSVTNIELYYTAGD